MIDPSSDILADGLAAVAHAGDTDLDLATVTAVNGINCTLSIKGGEAIALKACDCRVGDRVAIIKGGRQWIAVGVVGDVGARAPTGDTNSWLYATPQGVITRASKAPSLLYGSDSAGAGTAYDANAARSLLDLNSRAIFVADASTAGNYLNFNTNFITPYFFRLQQATPSVKMLRGICIAQQQIAAYTRNLNIMSFKNPAHRPVLAIGCGTAYDFSIFSLDSNGEIFFSFFETIYSGQSIEFYMTMML
jgi:hypothetical protein